MISIIILIILIPFLIWLDRKALKAFTNHWNVPEEIVLNDCLCDKCGKSTYKDMSIAIQGYSNEEPVPSDMRKLLSQGYFICNKCIFEKNESTKREKENDKTDEYI